MMLPVVSELSELYAATDAGATAALLAKLGVEKALGARLEETRAAVQVRGAEGGCTGATGGLKHTHRHTCTHTHTHTSACSLPSNHPPTHPPTHPSPSPSCPPPPPFPRLQSKLAASLKEYRLLHGAHMRNPGALLYPTSMRYLPALLLGLLKTTAFRWVGGWMGGQGRWSGGCWCTVKGAGTARLRGTPYVWGWGQACPALSTNKREVQAFCLQPCSSPAAVVRW
jgi:hypothetical protein